MTKELKDISFSVRQSRSDFHSSLPHSFLDQDLPLMIESSLQDLNTLIESVLELSDLALSKVTRLNESFE